MRRYFIVLPILGWLIAYITFCQSAFVFYPSQTSRLIYLVMLIGSGMGVAALFFLPKQDLEGWGFKYMSLVGILIGVYAIWGITGMFYPQ